MLVCCGIKSVKSKKEILGLSREVTIQSSSFSFQAMNVMVQGTNEKHKNKNKNRKQDDYIGVWYGIKTFNTVLWTDLPMDLGGKENHRNSLASKKATSSRRLAF